jgi:heme-degrading monooxygenase HmoA
MNSRGGAETGGLRRINRFDEEVEMYTRNVRIKLRANSVPEFRRILEEKIVPLLRTQRGFQDEITLLTSQRNEAIAISFWDNQENADAYNHVAYLDVLRALSNVIESLPIVETFELVDSTFHENTANAA